MRPKPRYFRHRDGFQDGTKYLRIRPGTVTGIAADGREWAAVSYTEESVYAKVIAGVWVELAPAEVPEYDLDPVKRRIARYALNDSEHAWYWEELVTDAENLLAEVERLRASLSAKEPQ